MRKFVIISDTGCDLEKKWRDQFDLEYLPIHYTFEEKEYEGDLDWNNMSYKEFYNHMRDGVRFPTSQVNVEQYKAAFRKHLEAGHDILSVSMSSKLSAGVNGSYIARDELLKEFPEAKIICIDTLRSCMTLGILLIAASELRAEGKTIEEVAAWIEENKLRSHTICTVDKLVYMKRAGRVSATSAFFGGLLNIKPIVVQDAQGRNFAVEKVKGRKKSFERIVEMAKENYEDCPHQRVFISHADCIEEAEELKAMLQAALGENIEISLGIVGCCIGGTVGPGMLCIHLLGKEVTLNEE